MQRSPPGYNSVVGDRFQPEDPAVLANPSVAPAGFSPSCLSLSLCDRSRKVTLREVTTVEPVLSKRIMNEGEFSQEPMSLLCAAVG